MYKTILFTLLISLSLFGCKAKQHSVTTPKAKIATPKLRFIGEQVIPKNTKFENTRVGGLSSIDYHDGKFYAISDDKKLPVRFYEMELNYNAQNFSRATITNMVKINISEKGLDPESLRYDKNTKHYFWGSEGFIRKGIDPTIYEISSDGNLIKTHKTPAIFKAKNSSKINGIRRNGTFEGLSMSTDATYYWIGMELPLKQDGNEPQLEKGTYPIRISELRKDNDSLVYQFAYLLDAIPRNSIPKNKFIVNGCPEILEIDENHFLFLERAYASGHKDGGNTIKIYLVDCSKATNIAKLSSLKDSNYIPAKKTLLFNFEEIRSQLTKGIVDNIEGITFGKKLKNGNRTLVVVSDNNFNKFNPQLTQLIVFEFLE